MSKVFRRNTTLHFMGNHTEMSKVFRRNTTPHFMGKSYRNVKSISTKYYTPFHGESYRNVKSISTKYYTPFHGEIIQKSQKYFDEILHAISWGNHSEIPKVFRRNTTRHIMGKSFRNPKSISTKYYTPYHG